MTLTSKIINTSLWGWIRVLRINTALIIGISVFLPWFFLTDDLNQAFIKALPFVFASMGAFATNDAHDVAKDKISKSHRPLPRGIVRVKNALLVGRLMISIAVVLALLASDTFYELTAYCIALLGCAGYNYLLKKQPLFKTIVTAIVSTTPLMIVVFELKPWHPYVFLLLASILFISARELLMDIRDAEADKQYGMTTLPILIGKKKTTLLSITLYFLSVVFILPIIIFDYSPIRLSLLITISIFIIICLLLWHSKSKMYKRVSIMGLWLPILLSIGVIL